MITVLPSYQKLIKQKNARATFVSLCFQPKQATSRSRGVCNASRVCLLIFPLPRCASVRRRPLVRNRSSQTTALARAKLMRARDHNNSSLGRRSTAAASDEPAACVFLGGRARQQEGRERRARPRRELLDELAARGGRGVNEIQLGD